MVSYCVIKRQNKDSFIENVLQNKKGIWWIDYAVPSLGLEFELLPVPSHLQ